MLTRPDILVLGGGGVLGEAWMMGMLAGVEDATGFDLRRCEYFVGTSAGSILASQLAAGHSPTRPSSAGAELESTGNQPAGSLATAALSAARRAGAWALAAGVPLAPLALNLSAPGGALVRAAMLRTMPRPRERLSAVREDIERSGVQFDGRLRVVAVDRRTGRRAVFGRPGGLRASVAEAVEASCTVPWLFAPVAINGREYVDGGIWSPTNLDIAPAGRDTYVLCLNPSASLSASHSLVIFARGAARSAVSLEALALRRRGASVQAVAPNLDAAAAMGSDFMDREPRARVLAAGYRQGLALAGAGAATAR
ncbi:MAG: patatin-like phospholipase family protein [Solirubrobacteraceae bacterium]